MAGAGPGNKGPHLPSLKASVYADKWGEQKAQSIPKSWRNAPAARPSDAFTEATGQGSDSPFTATGRGPRGALATPERQPGGVASLFQPSRDYAIGGHRPSGQRWSQKDLQGHTVDAAPGASSPTASRSLASNDAGPTEPATSSHASLHGSVWRSGGSLGGPDVGEAGPGPSRLSGDAGPGRLSRKQGAGAVAGAGAHTSRPLSKAASVAKGVAEPERERERPSHAASLAATLADRLGSLAGLGQGRVGGPASAEEAEGSAVAAVRSRHEPAAAPAAPSRPSGPAATAASAVAGAPLGAAAAAAKPPSVPFESENSVDTVLNQRERAPHLRAAGAASLEPGQFPMTPAGALRRCSDHLTNFEQSEVLDFPQIFYTGRGAKKIQGTPRNPTLNHGYDDDRGDYVAVTHDHIAYRCEILGTLGKGSFGQVLRCLDHKTGAEVAVKVIRNKKRFHHQALVELKVLEHLRHRDPDARHNVVHLLEYMYFRSHLCITFELLSINLYDFLKRNHFQGLPVALIRRFAVQCLTALRFLRRLRIIHCDLKPENILLRHPSKSAITVIDFGSSCFEDEKVYTYIQSRFYRSPEVMLGLPYSTAIDMWSLGCILAELYTGYPLFPGENEQEQIQCIMEIMGVPPAALVQQASRRKTFFDSTGQPRIVPNSKGRKRMPGTKTLAQVLRCSDPTFLSFLEACLDWDSRQRLSPEDALRHPWVLEGSQSRAATGTASKDGSLAHRSSGLQLLSKDGDDEVAGAPEGWRGAGGSSLPPI